MNVFPSLQKKLLMLGNKPHRPPNLASGHTFGPDEVRTTTRAKQIDLCLTVPEGMDVRW